MEIIFGKIKKLQGYRAKTQPRIKTRKVKEIPPSPFYDGKYHPPINSSAKATSATNYYTKVTKFSDKSKE
jgi:hypothetical protein